MSASRDQPVAGVDAAFVCHPDRRTITLIGTSTSLLASDLVTQLGYGSFELFSCTAVGIPVWLIGACYLVITGRFLPDLGDQSDDNLQALSRDG